MQHSIQTKQRPPAESIIPPKGEWKTDPPSEELDFGSVLDESKQEGEPSYHYLPTAPTMTTKEKEILEPNVAHVSEGPLFHFQNSLETNDEAELLDLTVDAVSELDNPTHFQLSNVDALPNQAETLLLSIPHNQLDGTPNSQSASSLGEDIITLAAQTSPVTELVESPSFGKDLSDSPDGIAIQSSEVGGQPDFSQGSHSDQPSTTAESAQAPNASGNSFADHTTITDANQVRTDRSNPVTSVVAEALVHQVETVEDGSAKKLVLQLHPSELGQVTLQVDWENDSLKAKILANEFVATELLNQNKQELVAALAENGISFDSLEVAYQDADDSRDNSGDEAPVPWNELEPETNPTNSEALPQTRGNSKINIVV